MKEYNKDEEDFDNFDNNNINEDFEQPSYFFKENIISPLKTEENSPITNNIEEKKHEYKIFNNIQMNNKTNFFENNINDRIQFYRYPLNDEQKKSLTPRNTTLLYQILDFFFNW